MIVSRISRFNRKDVTSYLEAYRAEMIMRDIPKDSRMSGFPWVVTSSIDTELFEVQAHCRNWSEFEGRLLERYDFDDSLRLSKREFMEWVKLPGKAHNTSTLLQEFEKCLCAFRHSAGIAWYCCHDIAWYGFKGIQTHDLMSQGLKP